MIITDKQEKLKKLPPIHPGEVLLEDFIKPLGLSYYRLAHDLGVSSLRVSQIARGKRAVTPDTAMRLGRYFGTSAEVWLRLQARYDLEVAQEKRGERIEREVIPRELPERYGLKKRDRIHVIDYGGVISIIPASTAPIENSASMLKGRISLVQELAKSRQQDAKRGK